MRSSLAHWRGNLRGSLHAAGRCTEPAPAQHAVLERNLAAGHSASHELAAGVRCLFWMSSGRLAPLQGACEEAAMREAEARTSCPKQAPPAHAASQESPQHRHRRVWRAAQHCSHRCPPLGQQERAASSSNMSGAERAHAVACVTQPGMSPTESNRQAARWCKAMAGHAGAGASAALQQARAGRCARAGRALAAGRSGACWRSGQG